ncbi:MAG: M48 family metallopeptidase [Candidatus Edwardsbacteria bacterium]|jgi:predicted Zn-dependent protease|nr:M48 family metallopeptidase [Candidatus Edwardsbacteria bacterium]
MNRICAVCRSDPGRRRHRVPPDTNKDEARKPSAIIATLAVIALLALSSCATVPVTGRSQLNLVPDSEMMAMSYQQYGEFIKASRLSQNQSQTAMVKRVGANIQKAVETYFAQNNLTRELAGFAWEYNLVDSSEVNAFCMPGGKVVVFSGILPVTRTEAGLAVVVGHEIAHAVAKHGSERMSQNLLQQLGGMALQKAIEQKPRETQQLWMMAFGLGSQLGVMLPYSRVQEHEADRLGMTFMAMAGYDPNAALDFWQRMSATGGAKPPEFLSTHPSDESRIANMKALLPEVMKYYKKP